MDGCRRRICNVERSYERSRLESRLLADAYRRVLPPRLFRLAQQEPEEEGETALRDDDVSGAIDWQPAEVNRTDASLAMEGEKA